MKELSLYGAIEELDHLEMCIEKIDSLEDQDMAASRMNDLVVYLQEKTDACYYYNLSLEDQITAHDRLIKELTASKKKLENKSDKFSDYALICMDKIGVKKLVGKFFQLMYKSPTLHVDIYDESLIPKDHYTEETEIITRKVFNKPALKEFLLLGAEIPGVRLKESKRSVQFKTK